MADKIIVEMLVHVFGYYLFDTWLQRSACNRHVTEHRKALYCCSTIRHDAVSMGGFVTVILPFGKSSVTELELDILCSYVSEYGR